MYFQHFSENDKWYFSVFKWILFCPTFSTFKILCPLAINNDRSLIRFIFYRLALNHTKQTPIAPGKFQQAITREKQNIAYDTEMHWAYYAGKIWMCIYM